VITAAAMRCLHGEMLGRLVVGNKKMEKRMNKMGISDPHKIYKAEDLAPGKKIIFAACGVTPGYLLQGVRFFGDGYRTHSLVMTSQPNTVSFRDTVHLTGKPDRRGVRLF
jgi:fructose-1,6-bisphosphatase/sedoheptulose 1,7-bisphosphatase-like protein